MVKKVSLDYKNLRFKNVFDIVVWKYDSKNEKMKTCLVLLSENTVDLYKNYIIYHKI